MYVLSFAPIFSTPSFAIFVTTPLEDWALSKCSQGIPDWRLSETRDSHKPFPILHILLIPEYFIIMIMKQV